MRKIWWNWDIRMRWHWGFSMTEESFVQNCIKEIDAAGNYEIEGIVIWGFLRDRHGGINAAKHVVEYAGEKGINIYPGVGIDDYGGVYYDGTHCYSLDNYLNEHPDAQALRKDGTPDTHRWPPNDLTARKKACPANVDVISFYKESLEWLVETFSLKGIQIEQGDSGLCYCDRCMKKIRREVPGIRSSASDAAERIPEVVKDIIIKRPGFTIISETYAGLTNEAASAIEPLLSKYPEEIILSWQLYNGPTPYDHAGKFLIEPGCGIRRKHGCAALRTNSDVFYGEIDDRANIEKALKLSAEAGLDMTYIYGEYPDVWPVTAGNYRTWAEMAR